MKLRTSQVSSLVGVTMLALAWGAVPALADSPKYKVFSCGGCTGWAENRATYQEVLDSRPPYQTFMILDEGSACYTIPKQP